MKKVHNNNNIGNPFHDEGTGEFTSPGKTDSSSMNEQEQSDSDLFDEFFGDDVVVEENEELENLYTKSNVDSRYTMMSDEEIAIVCSMIEPPPGGYFQKGEGGSYTINAALRKGDISGLSPTNKRIIEILDRNMKPLDKDIDVIRFVDKGYLLALGANRELITGVLNGDEIALNKLKSMVFNQTISEKGFMSTTFNQTLDDSHFAGRWDRVCRIDLRCKKGNSALFSPSDFESEMVLARGTKYKITKVELVTQRGQFGRENKTIVFSAEIV